jgi:hypothetical protein
MNKINLHFKSKEHITILLKDPEFTLEIKYLQPKRFDDYNLELLDPFEYHTPLDTEEVILGKFARGLKRIIFPTSNNPVEYLNANPAYRKNGLKHNEQIIIDSTDFELDD